MLTCSKCPEPSAHCIVMHTEEAPPLGQKDPRMVRIIRFCKGHWHELKELLPAPY